MSVVNSSQRQKIVIVNTGCANISSVRFALERLGVEVDVSDDVNVIKSAGRQTGHWPFWFCVANG